MKQWTLRTSIQGLILLTAGLLLFACSSAPNLSTRVQPGFNLSGNWVLDPARSDLTPDTRRVVDEMDQRMLRRDGAFNTQGELVDSAVFAFIAQDYPVLKADRLSIEQHPDSMGIRYEPGGYRDVSWGERARGLWTVHAGWDDAGTFVIHSDSEDIRGTERLLLVDPTTLRIELRVRADGGDLDLIRTFVRAP